MKKYINKILSFGVVAIFVWWFIYFVYFLVSHYFTDRPYESYDEKFLFVFPLKMILIGVVVGLIAAYYVIKNRDKKD